MQLNPSKCELLCVTNKCCPVKPTYCINNYHLQWVSFVKYLGVVVDSKLSWDDHISYVSSKSKNPEFIASSYVHLSSFFKAEGF